MSPTNGVVRLAQRRDLDAIQALQRHSMRALGRAFYSEAQLAAALAHLPMAQEALIDEGHFFVIEEAGFGLVATGGWSLLRPAYAAHRPAAEGAAGATVRLVFVHPERARRGLGGRIMRFVEADAMAAGEPQLALAATLSGVPLYRRLGFVDTGDATIRLPSEVRFPLRAMAKTLTAALPRAA